jgi:ABC-type multidrug transport system ATPase subunit
LKATRPDQTSLHVKSIEKTFKDMTTPLYGVSLLVDNHQIYGVVGPNGSSKSILYQILTGDMCKSFGDAFIDGCNVNEMDTERNGYKYGYSGQQNSLYSWMTVDQNFIINLKVKGMFDEEDQQMHIEILKRRFDLTQYSDFEVS